MDIRKIRVGLILYEITMDPKVAIRATVWVVGLGRVMPSTEPEVYSSDQKIVDILDT